MDKPNRTILIVEDDQMLRESLKIKLEKEGFDVLTANNGKEGLSFSKTHPIDLILLDIMMPELDGVEMMYYLRKDVSKDIPVIILTNLEKVAYPKGIAQVLIKSNTSLEEVVNKVKEHSK